MSSRARLAFPPDRHVIVTCDGPEVLVYAGDDERPLWRATCEAPSGDAPRARRRGAPLSVSRWTHPLPPITNADREAP